MNAKARRALRRDNDEVIQRRAIRKADPSYTPENDRLWRQEQTRLGGGMAGWVMYNVNPNEQETCPITGRIENVQTMRYTIPTFMPTGARAPRLDKVMGSFLPKK